MKAASYAMAVKRNGKAAHAPYVPIETRREQLIEAAMVVMKREGVYKTTTRLVAAEAGVPLSILHYCYETKADLLRAASRALAAELIDASRDAIPEFSPGKPPAEPFRRAFRAVWTAALRDVDAQLCTYEITTWALREGDGAAMLRDQYRDYFAAVSAFLRDVAETASIEYRYPVEALARWWLVTFDGMMLMYIVDRDAKLAFATMDIMIDALVSATIPRRAKRSKRSTV